MPFRDFREYLDKLESEGQLVRCVKEVVVEYEIGAVLRKLSDQRGPAIMFERVKGYSIPVVGNVCSSVKRVAIGLDVAEDKTYEAFRTRVRGAIPPKSVESSAVQEVVKKGDRVSLSEIPAIIHNELDAGRYISAGLVIAKHPTTGARNMGIYRLQVQGPDQLGIQVQPPQHLALCHIDAESKNKPFEVAICIGVEPAIYLAAAYPAPWQNDELSIAGSLRGAPVDVVRCQTVELEVPAGVEMILEGEMLTGVRQLEGPFGEVTGYYTPAENRQVIKIKTITTRERPLFQTSLTGVPVVENHVINSITRTATAYEALYRVIPKLNDVYCSFTSPQVITISIDKEAWGHEDAGKRALYAAMGTIYFGKMFIVVDKDVDVKNHDEIEWAIATAVQPAQDVIVFPKDIGMTLDPSGLKQPKGGRSSGKIGIDATRPLDGSFGPPVRPDQKAMTKVNKFWDQYVSMR